MKYILYGFILFAGTILSAQEYQIVMPDKRILKTEKIEVRGNGNLEYVSPDSKVSVMIPKGRYLFVRSPKPAEAIAGDQLFQKKEYAAAELQYLLAYQKARLLGWGLYTARMRAECLQKQSKAVAALNLLTETLDKYHLQDPELKKEYLYAVNLWLDLQLQNKVLRPDAEKHMQSLRNSDDPELIISGMIKQGDAAMLRQKYAEAFQAFGEALLLFPKHPERKELLRKCHEALKQLKAPGAEEYAKLLKEEFPEDNYIFHLK